MIIRQLESERGRPSGPASYVNEVLSGCKNRIGDSPFYTNVIVLVVELVFHNQRLGCLQPNVRHKKEPQHVAALRTNRKS